MSRQYQITQPRKCKICKESSDCDFIKSLFQKPFDVSGVLLDCKAFYSVFCELEERCNYSLVDLAKMEEQKNEENACEKPFLTPAMVTNGVFAAELALKALILKEKGFFDCIHDIKTLYYSLPEPHLAALSSRIKEKSRQSDKTLDANLEIIKDFFEKWRYFFQYESVGYSGFLLDFIHVTCDYAINNIEKDLKV